MNGQMNGQRNWGTYIQYNITHPHKKNEFESAEIRWMNLEPVIQSEVSQKEKHKYSILMHKYGIKNNGMMNLFAEQSGDADVENTYGHNDGPRGWDKLIEQH